jgi:hypothetical protein
MDNTYSANLSATESMFDMIPDDELDVSTLESEQATETPEETMQREYVTKDMTREDELKAVEDFLVAKRQYELENPPPPVTEKTEVKKTKKVNSLRAGRPRKSFSKMVTFVKLESDEYKLAGRGRPGKNPRVQVKVHYTWNKSLTTGVLYKESDLKRMAFAVQG